MTWKESKDSWYAKNIASCPYRNTFPETSPRSRFSRESRRTELVRPCSLHTAFSRTRSYRTDSHDSSPLSPAAADGINGTIANAAADSVASGVVNKDWENTKATANKGDWCTLKAVALTTWYVTGGVGIWASES